MGQRHQIYVRLPNTKGHRNQVIGIHHQWLWGRTALLCLENFLKFCEKAAEYNPFSCDFERDKAMFLLQSLYSINANTGYFHGTHPLVEYKKTKKGYKETDKPGPETKDPRKGDNNNGITIIDLSDFTMEKIEAREKGKGPVIKYCFMSVSHLECLEDDKWNNKAKNHFRPIGADEWIKIHYAKPFELSCDGDCSCKKDKKLVAEHQKSNKEVSADHKRLVDYLSKFQVLTVEEVKNIFPKMFESEKKESA